MVIEAIDTIARMNESGLLGLLYMEISFMVTVERYLIGGISISYLEVAVVLLSLSHHAQCP
jgi:hypothetical protein